MKQLITILSVLFISSGLFAQHNTVFNDIMRATLKGLSEAKTTEDYQVLANKLDRISQVEKERWEPVYYLALVKSIQAFEAKDKAAAASELATLTPRVEAILELKSVKSNKEVQSEIHTIMGMMATARMMENPMTLGAKFGPMRAKQLAKAEALDANNPRIWLQRAQNLFYTPEAFGGDKKKAKVLTEKALSLFQKQAAISDRGFMPRWGMDQAEGLLKSMTKKKKK